MQRECNTVRTIRRNLKGSTGMQCTVCHDAGGHLYRFQYACGIIQGAFKTSNHEIS
jgi:hypothetical protein